jgi:hypothetical protein
MNPLDPFATTLASGFVRVPTLPKLEVKNGKVMTPDDAMTWNAAVEMWRQNLERQLNERLAALVPPTGVAPQ